MISAFANSFKVPELRSRILFTLAMIVIVRIGTQITLPGIDPTVLSQWIADKAENSSSAGAQVAALLNIFSGGGLQTAPSSPSASCLTSAPASCCSSLLPCGRR